MILVIDNVDSFVETLARYCRELGHQTVVLRNDAVSVNDVREMCPNHVLLSPGPGAPHEAGISMPLIQKLHSVPIFGVCLGHQAIVDAYGGRTIRAQEPRHGRASEIHHRGDPIFAGVPSPFAAGRYHSLIGDLGPNPRLLLPIAWLRDGTVMAVRHRVFPHVGVQFHPESLLTPHGRRIIENVIGRKGDQS